MAGFETVEHIVYAGPSGSIIDAKCPALFAGEGQRLQIGTRIKLVVQAKSQPDNIATIPLLTATFVRPVHPVA
jgi:hypothetical protein